MALLESRDTGKPLALARAVDIPRVSGDVVATMAAGFTTPSNHTNVCAPVYSSQAISNFRFFAGSVRHSTTTSSDMGHAINYTHRSPVGVAGMSGYSMRQNPNTHTHIH